MRMKKSQREKHTSKSFHFTFNPFSSTIDTIPAFKLHLKLFTGLVRVPSHRGTLPFTPARRMVFTTLTSMSLFFTDGATGNVMVTVEAFWLHRKAMMQGCACDGLLGVV